MNGKPVISPGLHSFWATLCQGGLLLHLRQHKVQQKAGSEKEEKANEVFSLWLLNRKARVYSAT